ncbi:MAG: hypothetical protein IPM46_16790 [Flavobacteriales bacterium]|nr:hypothetical protein [Flavobacteriales bacterium]
MRILILYGTVEGQTRIARFMEITCNPLVMRSRAATPSTSRRRRRA